MTTWFAGRVQDLTGTVGKEVNVPGTKNTRGRPVYAVGGVQFVVYSTQTGGAPLTSLVDASSTPLPLTPVQGMGSVQVVMSDPYGQIPRFGDATSRSTLYLQRVGYDSRQRIDANLDNSSLSAEVSSRTAFESAHLGADDPHGSLSRARALITPLQQFLSPPVVGGWAGPPLVNVIGNNVIDLNTVYLEPNFSGPLGVTADQLDLYVQVAAATGSTVRTGVYVVAATPGTAFDIGSVYTLLQESDVTFSTTSTGRKTITPTSAIVIPPNTVFFTAGSAEGAACTVRSASASTGGGGNRTAVNPFGAKVDGATSALVAPIYSALAFTRAAPGPLPATLTLNGLAARNVWGAGIGYRRAA